MKGDRFSHRMLIPNEKILDRGKVVRGKIDKVTETSVSLSNGDTMNFDILVCANGANNNFGEAGKDVEGLDAMKQYFNAVAAEVKKAQKILIVGGGPVGVELAGEIKEEYADKQITLVEPHKTIIHFDPPFKQSFLTRAEKLLKKRDIKVIHGKKAQGIDMTKPFIAGQQTVTLANANESETVDVDLVLLSIGATVNSAIYPDEWLDESKRIKVRPTLQLEGKPKLFAVGDVNNIPEATMAYFAEKLGRIEHSHAIEEA